MKTSHLVLACVALLLAACDPSVPPTAAAQPSVPAADAAPRGFRGTFGFKVVRAEMVGPRLFLNSYPDYRDQRNL